jgi:REP element-mobilizing transposase RayT
LLRLLEAVIVARMRAYLHQSHNVSILLYHLVWPAKDRRVVFDARGDTVLNEVCWEITTRYAMSLLDLGTEKDHGHVLGQARPP